MYQLDAVAFLTLVIDADRIQDKLKQNIWLYKTMKRERVTRQYWNQSIH